MSDLIMEPGPDQLERAVLKACEDLGRLLGVPLPANWRRIRDELVTVREALHIEGDQTATDAARGLEDVAMRVVQQFGVGAPDSDDTFVKCDTCGGWANWARFEDEGAKEDEQTAIARVEHKGDCLLALAWHALGRPGAPGSVES